MRNTGELQDWLSAAADAAHHALKSVQPHREAFLEVLRRFESAVREAGVDISPDASIGIREAAEAFRARYDKLRQTLDGMAEDAGQRISAAYLDLERDAALVTIMLFGRSRNGKSTTMEALTRGDGASIGLGRQNTTTEVKAYYFPRASDGGKPEGPALRLVDAPGIEGLQGEELARMAEEFVERSDHILFLLSDDKATADELDRFGMIRTQGKALTVLLNLKTSDEDLDVLIDRPELIFRANEIEGHYRRICGYLERRFQLPPPHLIPIHARAGWLSRQPGQLPQNVSSREALERNSRLPNLENHIVDFIKYEAVSARLNAPRDLLLGHLYPLKDVLRPFAREFRETMGNVQRMAGQLKHGAEAARARVAKHIPQLRARFQAANDAIPGAVDSIIAAGGRGKALDSQWKLLLRNHGVADATSWFVALGQRTFESELAEGVRAAGFDYEFAGADDLDILLADYHDADSTTKQNKYARAAMRTAGGTGAAVLTTWAIANWWNPTGWVAGAAAALVIAGAGVLGEKSARMAAAEWERASRKDLYEKRVEIISKLRDRLWSDYRGVRAACGDWLDRMKSLHMDVVQDVARPIQKSAQILWQSTVDCLDRLDGIADHVNAGLITDLFRAHVPECHDGTVALTAIARLPGYRTKVIITSGDVARVSAMAACIGRQGVRIRQIQGALGEEQIDLVDTEAPMPVQVLQALGHVRSDGVLIAIRQVDGQSVAFVGCRSPSLMRTTVGPRGANVQLARKLLRLRIIVERIEP